MTHNLFGTDGIRNRVGSSPFTLPQLQLLGSAIGTWAQAKYGSHASALLAHDTRTSASLVKAALTSGLLMSPLTLYDALTLPTPAVCALMTKRSHNFGIIISASHNPYYDNGIKLVDRKTGKLSHTDEQEISALFYAKQQDRYDYCGTMHYWPGATVAYTSAITEHFTPNFLAGLTIALDLAHGATYTVAPHILRTLGAHVIPLHDQPNGININAQCGALFPQTLQRAVLELHADIGFAFDGDGDRVIVVTKYGKIKNGDDLLALLLDHPRYQEQQTIVGTIMSNEGLIQFAKKRQKTVLRTMVGDKYVSQELEKRNLLLGGEQSGHIVMRDYLTMGDSIFTTLRILEVLIATGNWEMNTFTKFPQLLINIPIKEKKDLNEPTLSSLIAGYKAQLPNGRLEVRYSGTENLLRVMIEDADETIAQGIGNDVCQALKKELYC